MKMRPITYELLLENNKFYIGKSNNIINFIKRLIKHFINRDTKTNEWIKKNNPVNLINFKLDKIIERKAELIMFENYCCKYNIANVRGAQYTKYTLSSESIEQIQISIYHDFGLCMRCGSKNHVINDHTDENSNNNNSNKYIQKNTNFDSNNIKCYVNNENNKHKLLFLIIAKILDQYKKKYKKLKKIGEYYDKILKLNLNSDIECLKIYFNCISISNYYKINKYINDHEIHIEEQNTQNKNTDNFSIINDKRNVKRRLL